MTEQQPAPIQSPLTLVMTAESAADFAALQHLVGHIQSLPRDKNPVVLALNKIATVHFARFVFLNGDQLAVITTYDDDFDDYLNAFIDAIGDVFNALLAHVKDGPPLPVQTFRQEFKDYVRANDLRCVEPFYSAYPDRPVIDIIDGASDPG